MRIGIDASCWANKRGYGRFTRELLKGLLALDRENEYLLFVDKTTAASEEFPSGIELVIVDIEESPVQAASADGRRGLFDMLKFTYAVSKEKLNLFFYPSVYTYFPIYSSAKIIVAIHDVIAETYPKLVFNNWKNKLFWDMKVWLANRQADLILTVSEYSKREIIRQFGFPEDFIDVTLEAADERFHPVEDKSKIKSVVGKYGVDPEQRNILYVGGISPHKNLTSLLKAFLELSQLPDYSDAILVLVGDYSGDVFLQDEKLKVEIDKLKSSNKIRLTGYVPDDELVFFYNAATVFVLPSFGEGFGLPALEAMACGIPVIGSETTSLPEVVGEAGLFFNPNDTDQLKGHLKKILTDSALRERLGRLGWERAKTFSWEKSAMQMLSIINKFKV